MTIQQMFLASGSSEVPLEYYYTCRGNSFTDGAYSSGFTHSNGTPKSSYTTTGTSIFVPDWNHNIGSTDAFVFYVEAVNSNSIYLDHTTSSSVNGTNTGISLTYPVNVNTEVYIWNLGNSASNTANSSSLIKQNNIVASVGQFNISNNAYTFLPTGSLVDGIVDTPLLTAGNYYAVGVNYKYIQGTTSQIKGSYIDLVGNSTGQKTQSSVIWQDGTHAVNIQYFSNPSFSGYTNNGTNNQYGQMSWWKWRRAE